MDRKVTWIALFSQTGSEIANLSRELDRKPDYTFYNRRDFSNVKVDDYAQSDHDNIMNWLRKLKLSDYIITLHGYLRIIPEDVCLMHEGFIFNGHPAAIDLYPELKGKDPQERTWNERERYPIIGSVVHAVSPRVDDGRIISSVHYSNRASTKDELYSMLKKSSLESWLWCLGRRL